MAHSERADDRAHARRPPRRRCVAFRIVSNPTPSEDPVTAQTDVSGEPEPVDLLGYLKRLAHHWLAGIITAVVVAAALFGAGLASGSDSVGSVWARTHVMVTMPAPTNEAQAQLLAASSDRLINSYLAVESSATLLADTAKILNDGTTTETLSNALSMYWGGGGQIIAFYALGTDQKQAEQRANAYAAAFVNDSGRLLPPVVSGAGRPTFTVVQPAFPSPANPSPTGAAGGTAGKLLKSPAVVAIAGIVVGLLAMAALEMRNSRRRQFS